MTTWSSANNRGCTFISPVVKYIENSVGDKQCISNKKFAYFWMILC